MFDNEICIFWKGGRTGIDWFIFPEHEIQLKNTIDKNCDRLKMNKSMKQVYWKYLEFYNVYNDNSPWFYK